ncbi:hypothetical protein AB0M02_24100 [Actinoplanes sp. NPDC051861]|uniref:hypothetical protein n=1 Tax=Actinoplanes sp. NPDC051861 TaxID=3155170 RepID=UPI003415F10F
MSSPWGRRVRSWAPVVAVVFAAGAVVAARATRRRTVAEEPQPAAVVAPVALPQEPGEPAAVGAGRRMAVLAGVVVLAVVAVVIIVVAGRSTPVSEVAPVAPPVSPSASPSPPPPTAPCVMVDEPLPWYAFPSTPAGVVIPPGELGFPACWNGVLGESAILSSGPGKLVKVTATRATNSQAGRQQPGVQPRETFRLHFEYAGTDVQGLDVRPVAWGAVERFRWIPSIATPFAWLRLEPDRDADQIVSFDRSQLVRLRISIMPDGNQGTAEWEL